MGKDKTVPQVVRVFKIEVARYLLSVIQYTADGTYESAILCPDEAGVLTFKWRRVGDYSETLKKLREVQAIETFMESQARFSDEG